MVLEGSPSESPARREGLLKQSVERAGEWKLGRILLRRMYSNFLHYLRARLTPRLKKRGTKWRKALPVDQVGPDTMLLAYWH